MLRVLFKAFILYNENNEISHSQMNAINSHVGTVLYLAMFFSMKIMQKIRFSSGEKCGCTRPERA